VAERAGTIAMQTRQRIAGVVENMSWMPCPHCDERVEVFGSGGGQTVADALTRVTGATVPLLGQIPIDLRLREGGDDGVPVVLADPDAAASTVLAQIAQKLTVRSRGLVGMSLSVSPAGR
jgi:ATP-binding protein involved in chromosome partitioning